MASIERMLAQVADTLETSAHAAAYVMWSALIEPGDRVAGSLIATHGVLDALHQWDALHTQKLSAATYLQQNGGDLTVRSMHAALQRWSPRADFGDLRTRIEQEKQAELTLITPEHPDWPQGFTDLDTQAPCCLWIRGRLSAITQPGVSIVGARAINSYGSRATADFAQLAVQAGLTVISGAAFGVDAVAHRTALHAGGTTIAVLAGGADRPYPIAHADLLEEIAQKGAVGSEMLPGSAPTRWRFLQRNRLIAALGRATLVTQAGRRSGSINTAHHAAALGRPLGAVPGPIFSDSSTGCHELIRSSGAELIAGTHDFEQLIHTIRPTPEPSLAHGYTAEPSAHIRVLDALPKKGSLSLDTITRKTGMSRTETHGVLCELEMLQRVHKTDQGAHTRWKLAADTEK